MTPRLRHLGIPAVPLLILSLVLLSSCARSRMYGSDDAWYDQQEFCRKDRPPLYKGAVRTSNYITMRDGVKLALDLYLPKGLRQGEKIPTIVMQTRYVRSMEYRWPFSLFLHGRFDDMIREFVTHGYAWVYVDARGSGASFGTRPYPYSPEEIRDGAEVVDWIVSQPWSNGKVGSMGSSYTGDSAVFLLTTKHPAIKAIMPRYAFFDAYSDVLRPGGIHLRWLTEIWGSLGKALDSNTVGDFLGTKAKIALKGTRPVDEDTDRTMLAAAIAEHGNNGDVSRLALDIEFRDDRSPQIGVRVDRISPYTRLADIRETGAPIYLYTGWYDASYVLSEINFFNSLAGQQRKLTIGPWEHGGWHNISPFAKSDKPRFRHGTEALRFFDATLRGKRNGILQEKPVSYFTLGEEKWKFADTWPPPGTRTEPYYFSGRNRLNPERPSSQQGSDSYHVDYTAGTGPRSRWVSLVNPLHKPIGYPDRRKEDEKLLCYTTSPLTIPMEVTGHPIVTLYVDSTADDGAFFVYLEDVSPSGRVTYVTEGMLRARDRKLSTDAPPYPVVTPYHTFLRKDALPLLPGQTAELVFDLYPVSYLYREGHAIRVALAGADKDHFAFIPGRPPMIHVFRNARFPSHIDLPVMQQGRP